MVIIFWRLLTLVILTSCSESFNKATKIWIKEYSVISFPKASIDYAKFLAKANLTLQDLSSVAAIITGNKCVFISSLLVYLTI